MVGLGDVMGRQKLVDSWNHDRSLSGRRRDPLHRASTDVADGKDTLSGGLEWPVRASGLAGFHKPAAIEVHEIRQPFRIGRRADHREKRSRLQGVLPAAGSDGYLLQMIAAVQGGNL